MILAWVCSLFPETAAGLWTFESESRSLDLGGSIRTIAQGFRNSSGTLLFGEDDSAEALSVTLLRGCASGQAWSRIFLEVHAVQALTCRTFPASQTGAFTQVFPLRYRPAPMAWDWAETDDLTAGFGFDRLNLRFRLPGFDVTLGRQAVNFSHTYFWNPLDVFLPFRPEAFDRDYKPGVDALRVDVRLGDFSGLTLAAVAGRRLDLVYDPAGRRVRVEPARFADDPRFGSALLGRGFTSLRGWDLSVQGGLVYGGAQVGSGFSGELFSIGLRGEAAYFWATEDRQQLPVGGSGPADLLADHASGVVGIDRRFENSLTLAMEYFFNGAGGGADDLVLSLARLAVGENQSLSRHNLGLLADYEVLPVLRGRFVCLFSLSDNSILLLPSLRWEMTEEAEVLIGAMIGLGDRPENRILPRSEYGTLENVFFGELKWYF